MPAMRRRLSHRLSRGGSKTAGGLIQWVIVMGVDQVRQIHMNMADGGMGKGLHWIIITPSLGQVSGADSCEHW
jgi:hypothetical protein